jgi:SsrA-binding protein
MTSKKKNITDRTIANNRRARFDYFIEQDYEAGIELMGSEVKSLRMGKANITDSYVVIEEGELFLIHCHIAEYKGANRFNHYPTRKRKLLLHRREIKKLIGKLRVKGYSLIPLMMYFNSRNLVKVKIALAKGKKEYDKRETIKEREWQRNKEQIIKGSY